MRVHTMISVAVALAIAGCSKPPTVAEQVTEQEAVAKKMGWYKSRNRAPKKEDYSERDWAVTDLRDTIEEMLLPPEPGKRTRDFRPEYASSVALLRTYQPDDPANSVSHKQAQESITKLSPPLDKVVAALNKPAIGERPAQNHIEQRYDMAVDGTLYRLLIARAELRIQAKDPRFLSDIKALRNFGRVLLSEPDGINMIVGLLPLVNAKILAMEAVQAHPADTDLIAKLSKIWEAPIITPNFRLYWIEETNQRLLTIGPFVDTHAVKSLAGPQYGPANRELLATTRLKLLQIANESLMGWDSNKDYDLNYAIQMIKEPSRETMDVLRSYHPFFKELSKGNEEGLSYPPLRHLLEGVAQDRMAYLALKILKASHGKGTFTLPKEAAEPQWADPYSNKPFLLKQAQNGFTLYSVGENRKDDGGSDGSLDVTFSYPIPK